MSLTSAPNKVLVTGIGAVTSLGSSFSQTWNNLIHGYSGIRNHEFSKHPELPCKISAGVPRIDNDVMRFNDAVNNNNPTGLVPFDPKQHLSRSESYYTAHSIQYALAACAEAIKNSAWDSYLHHLDDASSDRYRMGVSFATGMGGLQTMAADHEKLLHGQYKRISAYSVPNMLVNSSAGAISLRYRLRGPNLAASTACAASLHSIQEAYALIASGMADMMICGGSEAAITPLGIASFSRCRALSTKYNHAPCKASRPFDANRDGFVMGDGAAALVLESEAMAKKRGATNIYGEIVGVGATADAYHVTSLDPNGQHIQKCMQLAIEMGVRNTGDARLVQQLGYFNAHATSTEIGDKTEIKAILQALDDHLTSSDNIQDWIADNVKISSTKSALGHLLGASGAIEACFTLQALKSGTAPPTLNLDDVDPAIPSYVNLVPHQAQPLTEHTNYAISNSFGFGGTNASILFKKRGTL